MSTLYEIAEQMRELSILAENWDDDDQVIQDTLEGLQGDLAEKADNIAKLVKMLDRQADACELESIRLKDRANRIRIRSDRIKEYLMRWMKVLDIRVIENALFDIRIRKLPPSIQLDEELLPPRWYREKVTQVPDKAAIKAAIQEGKQIAGATLVSDKERLYIK